MSKSSCRRVTLGLSMILLLTGCWSRSTTETPKTSATENQPTSGTCTIAVIDLDRVANGIGAVEKMRLALLQLERETLAEVRKSTASLFGDSAPTGDTFAEFDKSTAALVDAFSPQQQKEFVQIVRTAQNQMMLRERQFRDDFLNEVRPYAFQMARGQGCQLVLTTDQVYVATEQVDITSAVIQKINEINAVSQTSPATTTAQPSPRLASGGSFPTR